MEPSALLFNGKAKFYNFTHYNTQDLVRAVEAPYRARLAAGVVDAADFDPGTMLHLSYGGVSGAKVKVIGYRYRHNGLRIRHPNRLHDNPMEALADNTGEVPLPVVYELLLAAAMIFSPSPAWDHKARQRKPDIDMKALAGATSVRIEPNVAMRQPKGYISPIYAANRANSRCRGLRRRAANIIRDADKIQRSVKTVGRFLSSVEGAPSIPPEIAFCARHLEREARELYEFFMQVVCTLNNIEE